MGLYFLVVIGYGLWPVELTFYDWAVLDHWHEAIGVIAGYLFAFKRHPLDKAAMAMLVLYILGLAVIDPLISHAYGWAIALIGSTAIGWLLFLRWRTGPLQGYESGLDKDAIYRADGDRPDERGDR